MVIALGWIYWNYTNSEIYVSKSECKRIDELYEPTNIKPLGTQANTACLREYNIKTAYNCCALTNYSNAYVNLCALESCLNQGYRALHFEIFLIGGLAHVACSSSDSIYMKTTFNSIPVSSVLKKINFIAFSSTLCPSNNNSGWSDPLILIFKIKSNDSLTLNNLASAIQTNLGERLLPGNNLECPTNSLWSGNIGQLKMNDIKGKALIVIDDRLVTPNIFEASDLFALTTARIRNNHLLTIQSYRDILDGPKWNTPQDGFETTHSITFKDSHLNKTNAVEHICGRNGKDIIIV